MPTQNNQITWKRDSIRTLLAARILFVLLQNLRTPVQSRSQGSELLLGSVNIAKIDRLVHSGNNNGCISGVLPRRVNGVVKPGTIGQAFRNQ